MSSASNDEGLKPSGWSIEPHGDSYVVYYGRDDQHHGFNVCTLSEIDHSFLPAFIDHVKFAQRRATPKPAELREAMLAGARFIEYVTERTEPESANQQSAINQDRRYAALLRQAAGRE
jgi:hypothetical protein